MEGFRAARAQDVQALQDRVAALEAQLADLKSGLRHLLPQPNVPLNPYDPHAPRPVEETTVIMGAHPDWSNGHA